MLNKEEIEREEVKRWVQSNEIPQFIQNYIEQLEANKPDWQKLCEECSAAAKEAGLTKEDTDRIIKESRETIAKANKYDSLVKKIKDKIEEKNREYNDILSEYGNLDTDVIINVPNANVRKHLDDLVIEIVLLQELLKEVEE